MGHPALVSWAVARYYMKLYVKQLNWRHRRVRKWGLFSPHLPRSLRREAVIYGFTMAKKIAHEEWEQTTRSNDER